MDFAPNIDQIIMRHLQELKKPGAISVRPGYQVAGGWPTKKPAIVVTVVIKTDDLPAQDRLPETIEGISVDVRQASPLQKLRASNPALYTAAAASAAPEVEEPAMPYERDLTGQLLAPLSDAVETMARATKQQLKYVPPSGFPLKAVTDKMTITCHASPDAGWAELKPFLEETETSLTVGMYDFTCPYIEQTVQSALGRRGKLNLVLDHPPKKSNREQSDDDTEQQLDSALGNRFAFAWALEQKDPKVTTYIFKSAYHIKVAVRDSSTFWLSSGNWNTTNQPDIDPFNDPQGAASIAKKSDRDWHVIVEHEGLAKLYEAYLLNDLKVASANQTGAAMMFEAVTALAQLAEPDALSMAARVPQQYFEPKTITATMKIQPLLSPDNYVDAMLGLVNSAKESLYIQLQYINYSDKPQDAKFAGLVAAVIQKINDGVDVRIIVSEYENSAKLELLQGAGMDLSHVKIQANVHNKGFVIDSKVVAVGSQNWSGDGVLRNRDATLIIYNQEAAEYWEQIFIHDWTKMANQRSLD